MRVIPDSDDESDVDLEAESPPRQPPGATAQQTPNLGTASTDSLKQAFATVHHAHLQSSASHDGLKPPIQSQLESKRRVTMDEATTRPVPESANLKRRTQSSSQTTVSKPGSETIHLLASPYPTENLQDDFARHNPIEMFPEASSTVPNATATQRRILERCANPGLGGSSEQPLQLKRLSPDPLISLSQNTTLESPQPVESHRRTSPPSDDELADFGMPQEVYKARPTRSRSQKSATSNLIDPPNQPGNVNNTRKRRRTRNDSSATTSMRTPEKMEYMHGSMGFSPSKASMALEQNDGNVERAVLWLLENNVSEDELVVHHRSDTTAERIKQSASSVTKSTSPPPSLIKAKAEAQYDTTGSFIEPFDAALNGDGTSEPGSAPIAHKATTRIVEMPPDQGGRKSPVKVQVVIPKKVPASSTVQDNSKATRKKAKCRKTTSNDPEAHSEIPTQPSLPTRNADEGQAEQNCSKEVVAGQALEALPLSPPADAEEQQLAEKTHQAPQATVTGSTKEAPNTNARDPEKKAKPVDQSPSNSTKVPHRVGLSRRARIAPLLRVLGKK